MTTKFKLTTRKTVLIPIILATIAFLILSGIIIKINHHTAPAMASDYHSETISEEILKSLQNFTNSPRNLIKLASHQNEIKQDVDADTDKTPLNTSKSNTTPQVAQQTQPSNVNQDNASQDNFGKGGTKSIPSKVTLVDKIKRTETSTTTKYGTKILTTSINTYDIYSDGSEKLVNSTPQSTEYDFSTFRALGKDMWSEASAQVALESANIQQVLTLTNQYRAEIGSDPLVLDANLNIVANIRAIEMAWSNTFSHTRPNGQTCYTLVNETGVPFYGENLARGDNNTIRNGTEATIAWRYSKDHYFNMIAPRFKKLGVGAYKLGNHYYFVQLFDE